MSATDFDKYKEALSYINNELIRKESPYLAQPKSPRKWMEDFFNLINNPQRSFPAIHIGGTSGKGSCSTFIANILSHAGYKTGLHLTPYLQVATEKFWINGQYICASEYLDLMNYIKPFCEKFKSEEVPIHGLASFAIVAEYFRRNKIDVGVIEVGVGGENDITNVLKSDLSIVTNVGEDHLNLLGPTKRHIAQHKAGIFKEGKLGLITKSIYSRIFKNVAGKRGTTLIECNLKKLYEIIKSDTSGSTFNYSSRTLNLKNLEISMAGSYQIENASLSIYACEILKTIGYKINEEHIREGLKAAKIPGRFEIIQNNPTVILDGAHNKDKINALCDSLKKMFGKKDFIFVFGAIKTKNVLSMLKQIEKIASKIILTEPQVYQKETWKASDIAIFSKSDKIKIEPDYKKAFAKAQNITNKNSVLCVTGSLFLVGNVRGLCYNERDILEKRTSFWR